uniref:UPAR/Ly6 domain-containing protein n=2 Tax=Equus TaxID=9789 RepID=A0A9L0SGQ4_HORSE|nr:protein PIP-1-like [Equus asinus]
MGKHLLLPLVILSLLLGFLQALYCFHCNRVNASGYCECGGTICKTKKYQQCYLGKVYEGSTFSFGYQGCRNLCFPFMRRSHKSTLQVTCCNKTSFCNKF